MADDLNDYENFERRTRDEVRLRMENREGETRRASHEETPNIGSNLRVPQEYFDMIGDYFRFRRD